MIQFERLIPERKAEYDKFLMTCGQRGCEYSFVNLYLWGRQTAAVLDGYLILFSHFNGHSVYPFPVGQGDIRPVLDAVIEDSRQRGIPCRFTSLNQGDMELLEAFYPGKFRFRCDRSDFDYVYHIDDLADLKGRKFQQKRNHVNRFEAAYPDWRVEELNDATMDDALAVGLDRVVPVRSSGCAMAGTDIRLVDDDIRQLLQNADLILAKGQGNFETMNEGALPVYFAFLCKCDWFTRRFGLEKYKPVFVKRERLKINIL